VSFGKPEAPDKPKLQRKNEKMKKEGKKERKKGKMIKY
jgi:hypothetical protein